MANDTPMTDKHYISLQTDVKAILNLLEGSKRFGRNGLVDEVDENKKQIRLATIERQKNETRIQKNESDLTNFKTKIIAWTAGAAAVATAVIQVLMTYFL